MSRFFKIGEAAKILGVSIQILRRWEEQGDLIPHRKSKGKTRYYTLEQLTGKSPGENELTVAYARVSSQDQKEDLERQLEFSGDPRSRLRHELSEKRFKDLNPHDS